MAEREQLIRLNSGGLTRHRRDVVVYWLPDRGLFELRAWTPQSADWWMRTNSGAVVLAKLRQIIDLAGGVWRDWSEPV